MVVAEMPTFAPKGIDYSTTEATYTLCRLLNYIIQVDPSDSGHGASEHSTVFQINHARILELEANENFYTNAGDRLFPTVLVIDSSGTSTIKMHEKAALELSGQGSKEEFADLASKGALNFPILCSLRIVVQTKPNSEDAAENKLDVFKVEAVEQDLCPRAMPNASMEFLSHLMRSLPSDLS